MLMTSDIPTMLRLHRAMFLAREIDRVEQDLVKQGLAHFHVSGAGHESTAQRESEQLCRRMGSPSCGVRRSLREPEPPFTVQRPVSPGDVTGPVSEPLESRGPTRGVA